MIDNQWWRLGSYVTFRVCKYNPNNSWTENKTWWSFIMYLGLYLLLVFRHMLLSLALYRELNENIWFRTIIFNLCFG